MSTDKDKLIQELKQEIEYLEARLLVSEDDVEKLHHVLREQNAELVSVRSELAEAGQRHWTVRQPQEKHIGAGHAVAPVQQGMDARLSRKTILVLDRHVPEYDRSSGARSLHAYMRLFLAMGYDVAFIAEDFEVAEPYASELLELGIKVLAGGRFEHGWRAWVEQNATQIFAVLVAHMDVARRFMRFIKKHVDAPALYFAEELNEMQGGVLQTAEEKKVGRALAHIVMHDADTVLLFDEKQREALAENYPVRIVRIPLYFYYDIPARKTGYKETKDLLFVGSFYYRQNVEGIFWFIEEVLPLVKQALPEIKLRVVGEGVPEELLRLAGKDVEFLGYVTDPELEQYYGHSRICIVPILKEGGVKGKTVEAMAHGVPFVSTTAGLAGLPEIGQVAEPADAKEEFAARVVQKYLDEAEWRKTCDAYRKYLREFASFEEAERIWKTILGGAADR